jgi:ferredoxin
VKNIIIYFTGTGNSLAVSRLLAVQIPQTEIFSVGDMLNRTCYDIRCDTCGFVFPVCCQDAPEIIKRLVRRVQLSANVYVYAIATHNGDVGYTHFTLDRILKRKGQNLKAGFDVLMPGNSITPGNNTNSEEENWRRVNAAAAFVDKIAGDVLKRASLPYVGTDSLRKHLKGLRNMLRHRVLYKVPKKFWITDACNQCGICARICPENNIQVDANSVTWGKHCQMCLACIHWCPKKAIQNGEGTIKRIRYHHPDISIDDMICR